MHVHILGVCGTFHEIIPGTGPGYMDTLGGLVFFLLIGKWMQSRTFAMLSFERDYTSFFPVAVTVLHAGIRKSVPVARLQKGDRIFIGIMSWFLWMPYW